MSEQGATVAAGTVPGVASAIGFDPAAELARALEGEGRLLRTLGEILCAQREGVARDDLEGVERSVYDAQRVLGTLAEARRRRRQLLAALGGDPDARLEELEHALGTRLTPALRAARDGISRDARELSRELRINQGVLESAVSSGHRWLQMLRGGSDTRPVYGRGSDRPRRAAVY